MRMNGSECPQCGIWHIYESWGQAPRQNEGTRAFVSDQRSWKVLESWAKIAPSEEQITEHLTALAGREGHDLGFIRDQWRDGKCTTSSDLACCIAADRLAKAFYNSNWYDTIRGPYIPT
jgi:hypothetical protein